MELRGASRQALNALVVSAPVDYGLFDGFLFELLGEGAVGEGGDLFVRGESKCDELLDRELVDVGKVGGWEKRCEAETLFEANDAVLHPEGVYAGFEGENEKSEGDDDTPVAKEGVFVPEVDGNVDRDAQVNQENREDEEMHGWIEAHVIAVVLRSSHEGPFVVDAG
jgi:hypothetical protein